MGAGSQLLAGLRLGSCAHSRLVSFLWLLAVNRRRCRQIDHEVLMHHPSFVSSHYSALMLL